MKRILGLIMAMVLVIGILTARSVEDNYLNKVFINQGENASLDMMEEHSYYESENIENKYKKYTITKNSDQSDQIDVDEINRMIDEAMQEVEKSTTGVGISSPNRTVSVRVFRSDSERPYVGVAIENLSVNKAADLGYDKFFGVLITRVVPNSPAALQQLLPDDIVMEIDGNKIINERIFTSIVSSYNIGDMVEMKLFRNRKEKIIDFTFGSRHGASVVDTDSTIRPKTKLSAGEGGLSWIPIWFTPKMDDINGLINDLGFTKIDDRGQLLNSFGLKFGIGNNLFLGGILTGYSLERKTSFDSEDFDNDVIRKMNYSIRLGGITLEKRIPLTKRIVGSLGSMIGWGKSSVEVSQTNGIFQWDSLSQDLGSSYNNYFNISKSHIFVQPKVELYYRLTDWLSIRSEIGYIASYSTYSGWKADISKDEYEVKHSPDTSFDGVTVSIGPWLWF